MTRVILDGLVKQFDRVAVVDGASLETLPGELTVVVGPSCAGKTILMHLIAGLERPDEGEIYFDGRVMNAVPPEDRRVGLLFQDDALWPHLTVAENVGYGLKVKKVPRRERRRQVAQALESARIDTLADRRPAALTLLQRQRAALARALVVGPAVLVLDEPLGRLEPRARDEFREDFRRVHAETATPTIILTRDPREALSLADRLAVMDLGRIVQVGPPQEVYNRPANPFVAQFLGPANLLHGLVDGSDGRGEVIVRTPLGRLLGHAPAGPPPQGSPVTVAIRPEALAIGAPVPGGSNRFVATLERQDFLGETRRIHLRGPGDWPVIALALQGQSQGLREGQSLTVSVPPDRVIVLPGKYAAAPT